MPFGAPLHAPANVYLEIALVMVGTHVCKVSSRNFTLGGGGGGGGRSRIYKPNNMVHFQTKGS